MRFCKIMATIAIAAMVITVATAFTSGSPTGMSGAPGHGDCTNCHGTFPLNSGSASFAVFAPEVIQPGATVPLFVHIGGSTSPTFGFDITARDAAGSFVGSWTITDSGTKLVGSQEVSHDASGATRSFWTVDWTAPANLSSSSITFYATGLEGNGGGTGGDRVYATSTTVPVANLDLQATTASANLALTLTGSASQTGHEYFVFPTLNPAPGPFFGITPDVLTTFILFSPPVLPGFHGFLPAGGSVSAAYPAGFLAPFVGMPLNLVGATLGPAGLSGFSQRVTITP